MRKLTAVLVLASVYLSIFAPFAAVALGQIAGRSREKRMNDIPAGFTFRLSEGVQGSETRTVQPPATSEPISEDLSSSILKRLPAIESDPSDQTEFSKRIGTLPAPKTGNRIPVKFPADADRALPNTAGSNTSLEVLRFSPEGEVPLAPDLSVTFSQPMVAVTSQEEAANYAPVEFTPQVEGRWRWLGTKTLMFDTDKRFPMATKFTARIAAGTKSATGQALAKDFSWTFTTPPPKVEQMIPQNQVVRRDALMFIRFDQAINPEAVLRTISVLAGGRKLATRLATEAEIAADGNISYHAKQTQPGRWVAFRAVNANGGVEDAMPGASTITVNVEKGTPSAEGPLTTVERQPFQFTTYGPFKYRRSYCGWESKPDCSPFDAWYVEFNNPIDSGKFAKEMVKVEPAVEGLNIYPSGNYVYFQDYKKGNTTYKVTLDGGLTDNFGQTLGRPAVATFKVGPAPQNFYAQGGSMVVLDLGSKPAFSIYTTNHSNARVRMYRVTPENWYQFTQYFRRMNYDDGERPAIPGSLISETVVPIKNIQDELVETRIDLSAALPGGLGNIILDVEPTVKRDKYDRSRVFTWVQGTHIGLDAFVDNEELVGFATDLATGKALNGVQLSIYPNGAVSSVMPDGSVPTEESGWIESAWEWIAGSGGPSAGDITSFNPDGSQAESEAIEPAQSNSTGPNGILRLSLPETPSNKGMSLLVAKRGGDTAFLPENTEYYWQDTGSWYKRASSDSLRWFVFDDRGMYKPNEEVSVKGYIRRITGGKLGDVEGLGDAASGLTWSAKDPRNNEIAKGEGELNAFGAFDLKFKLPDNANLGYARIDLHTNGKISGENHSHQFQIQEFRRPEFEVTAKVETEAPHIVGGHAMLSVDAQYYAGGGLPNAEANWTVTATPTSYTPPNRGDFTFGTWVPWWGRYDYNRPYGGTTENFKGVTDAEGRHLLRIDFDSVKPPRPYTISASASVQDVNRQTFAGRTSMLVHPADLYVGIRTPRTFVQKGEAINVESIVTDIDGKLIPNRDIEIKAVLKDWQFDKGSWNEITVDEQTCTVKSEPPASAGGEYAGVAKCSFTAKAGGRYTVTAMVMDDRERPNESEFTIWVPGGKQPPKRNVEQEEVQIIPNKKDYAPGETAELLVIAPFAEPSGNRRTEVRVPVEGVLTLRRDGIVKTERFTMKDSSITLKIPLDEKYLPNINAQVDLVGSAERNAAVPAAAGRRDAGAPRPAFASGNINLSISTASRKLTVSAEPKDKTLVPGGETKVDIEVKDDAGEPVANSEVAVVIVDESVLALSGYSIADPMSIFYTPRGTGTTDHHLRKDVLLGNPDDVNPPPPPPSRAAGWSDPNANFRKMENLATLQRAPAAKQMNMAADSAAESVIRAEDQAAINLRENFDALAVWSPSVKTDSNGRATVDVKLPDNLTRYRITAVSVDQGRRFGRSESNITAKKPLMVRPSAPRFMNFGDRVELPVVVQNQTDQDMTVDVAVRATNADLTGGDLSGSEGAPGPAGEATQGTFSTGRVSAFGKRVLVKANSREEVRFPVSTVKAGTARFQIAVTSGKHNDAAEVSLPVWTPATTEAFATYGTTDQDGAIIQPVQAPGDVYPQFGGLEITTSSTQLQELTDAYIYLANYPYECSEQIASRMISTAALRDVLTAFKAKDMPSAAELEAKFKRDIQILQSRQREDGSFGLWQKERERYEYPFLTVHVAHALALAKAKGYNVPDEMLNRAKPYLSNIESHMNDQWHKASPQARWTISAYALYVRDIIGDKDAGKAKNLLAEARSEPPASAGGQSAVLYNTRMPFEALGWILSVLADDKGSAAEVGSIIRFLMNRTTETASTANFVTDYGDGGWLIMYSNRRADGVLLEALIRAQPNNDLIPKLVRGLLAHRTKGHWGSTQENVFILLALDKYFNAFEKVTPDFVTRIWLGSTYAGEEAFKGRSVDSNVLNIPMSYLLGNAAVAVEGRQDVGVPLIIDRQGAGRLYYRIGMKYAPKNLKLEPADCGFTVLRKYEAVDNKDDVKHNADGSWTIKSGARVRIRLTMVAQARRYHVALVDKLPAGLEILNPELKTTEAIPPDTGGGNTGVVEMGSRSYGRNYYWWRWNWFEHQNFRDERAEAFSSLLWEGVYNYTYVARATTPGQFVVPPAKAEEMYAPETFGRTGTDFVNVE
ncbi:MAG: Ig-like domain-containing protein [Acidobacteria bacterium]|nr:Ig-like domain-containing protein [Acidobacteriota bacterium]